MRWALQAAGGAAKKALQRHDVNQDGLLNPQELQELAREVYGLVEFNYSEFVHFVTGRKGLPDTAVTIKEVLKSRPGAFFEDLLLREPYLSERYSNQVWLEFDKPPLRTLLQRAQVVTGLPSAVIRSSEPLQVVNYPLQGHYSCHHDSSPDSIDAGDARLGTLAVFLNEVRRGGETVFPGADREGAETWSMEDWEDLETRCQPRKACAKLGGVTVAPRRGDAILWYNVRPTFWTRVAQGTFGHGFGNRALLWSSLHCGAEVLEGEKSRHHSGQSGHGRCGAAGALIG